MTLRYLQFETSEGSDDTGSFDAMASAPAAALPALLAELSQVLGWAFGQFPGRRGPLDEGFSWDYDLQATQEVCRPEHLQYDEASGRLLRAPAAAATATATESVRHTVSLCVCGTADFCAAFRARFGVHAD